MNKLDRLLKNKTTNLLSIYFTAGYPKLNDTKEIIDALEANGADLIEIGIPFSDPVADGPVIQFSNSAALENGMSLKKLFEQLMPKNNEGRIPKIMMGYFNPIFQFGVEKFCKECNTSGIDGVIIPDLPLDEFESSYKSIFNKYNIHFIFLVTPQTSVKRLMKIDNASTSFIYAVSTNSTTGGVADFKAQEEYFKCLKDTISKPFLIGFGVKNKSTFHSACNYANGAIIGSSFITAIAETGELKEKIRNFIHQIKN